MIGVKKKIHKSQNGIQTDKAPQDIERVSEAQLF